MLDTMSNGRIIAGMLRARPTRASRQHNPAESRARFEEALLLIREAWTQPKPFGCKAVLRIPRDLDLAASVQRRIRRSSCRLEPESADFAGRNHVSLGLAVTTCRSI